MKKSNMNSSKTCSSPTYKNLKFKHKQSPVEIKDKLRKDYKSKVQNCRDTLLNRYRGNTIGPEIQNKLKEIYRDLYDFSSKSLIDEEEGKFLEEIKNELVQEELEWWLEEYDKYQNDIDWSTLQQEENVICPVCQKTNFNFINDTIVCPHCKITINTNRSALAIKKTIIDTVEKHSAACTKMQQFTTVTELSDTHIYAICNSCGDMQLVI